MDEKELISTLTAHLSDALSEPVRAGNVENERPVPLVLIEDWDSEEKNHHNSAKAGEAYGDFDNDGEKEYEWYLNFSSVTRVEISIRHTDEIDASHLKSKVKSILRIIAENPQSFHDDLKNCNLGSDGRPRYSFTEPAESDLMISARFHADHTVTRKRGDVEEDTIEQWADNFQFC